MLQKFKIASTSNLMGTNACWNLLAEQIAIEFSHYGDVSSDLLLDNEDGVILVVFLEDIVSSSGVDHEKAEASIVNLINLLKKRASSSNKPTLVCLASKQLGSVVELSKRNTRHKKYYSKFKSELKVLRDNYFSIHFINLNEAFYYLGAATIFSDRNWYLARCRLSVEGLETLASTLTSVVKRLKEPAKKVLVLDCDNTIWGGVVGEDGIGGLVLGQDGLGSAFVDFQMECLRLAEDGILLALASKNNNDDVWEVFEKHPAMVLQPKDIITSQINWNEKSDNVLEIADVLDLNPDSFVFWDDNPIERNKMRQLRPEVLTIEVPKSITDWPDFLRNCDCFSRFIVTEEDKKKVKQYKSRSQFKTSVSGVSDINEYLSTINLLPFKKGLDASNVSRAEQMCQKTNQFNLRSKRYSSEELLEQSKNPKQELFMTSLTDDFGDHGNVALVSLQYYSKNIVFIDAFLMSCRILGRHLEAWLLEQIFLLADEKSSAYVVVDFIQSEKNKIALNFLRDYGFHPLVNSELGHPLRQDLQNYESEGVLYFIEKSKQKIPNLEIFRN